MSTPEPAGALLEAQLQFDAWADAAASSLGLNRTDFSALRAVLLEGPCSAGRIGELTGLSSGAITGTLDRLERAGFVRRESDPDDRRKVIATVPAGARARLAAAYAIESTDGTAAEKAAAAFSAHFSRARARLLEVQGQEPEASPTGALSFPLGGRIAASLEIAGGAMDLSIDGDGPRAALAACDFGRGPVKATERGGNLRISHRGRWGGGRPSGRVSLNPDLAWAIRIGGGANRINFGLEDVAISGIEVEGGSNTLRFALGAPRGELAIRVNGGASKFFIERSAGVMTEVVVRGRASSFVADGVDMGSPTNLRWASATGSAESKIRLSVRGGLNHVTLSVRP
jgi:DNA-binding MarR family transcriptional regulator